ncbi:MAG: PqqD family protein [Oligoflexia bacterium]|nr:PqqD family protein [Oligoflexia bacterium]
MNWTITKNLPWQQMDGKVLILNTGENKAHELNEVASEVWLLITQDKTLEEINTEIQKAYDIDSDTAKEDVDELIKEFKELKLLV